MRLRSLLFVPADSARKFDRAREAGADGLILDLEDSVAPDQKAAARECLGARIAAAEGPRDWSLWVRINGFGSGLAMADLAAAVRPGLDGIVLPKAAGAADVARLAHCLDALEARAGLPEGRIRIIPVATETAAAVFALPGYAPAHPRLAALTWGAEDLSADIGAASHSDGAGRWFGPYEMARNLCLLAATAAGVPALDTVRTDFRDLDALAGDCAASFRDGFAGRLAIHPAQLPVIHAGYTPAPEDLALARRILAAFDADPGLGAVGIDGRMYDIPHLTRARRLIAAAGG